MMKIFRIQGLAVAALLAAALTVFILYFLDPLLKSLLEKGLSSALERQVSVGKLETALADFTIRLEEVAVQDPKEKGAAFWIRSVTFQPAPELLLEKKLMIREMEIRGLKARVPFAFAEETEASAGEEPKAEKKEEEDSPSFLSGLSFPDPRKVVESDGLPGVAKAKASAQALTGIKERWKGKIDAELSNEELKTMEAEAKALEKRLGSIKDAKDLLAAKKEAEAFMKKVEGYKKRVETMQKEFRSDYAAAQKEAKALRDLPEAEWKRIKEEYLPEEYTTMGVVQALFGDETAGYVKTAAELYDRLAPYLESEEEPAPPRLPGRYVTYGELPQVEEAPLFYLGRALVDGELNGVTFSGQIRSLSSDPAKMAPMTALFQGTEEGKYDNASASLVYDHSGSHPFADLRLEIDGLAKEKLSLDRIRFNDNRIDLTAHMTVDGERNLAGAGTALFTKTSPAFQQAKSKEEKLVAEVVESVKGFRVDGKIGGTVSAPALSITSDLDKKLSNALGKVIDREKAAFAAKLEKEVKARAGTEIASLTDQLGGLDGVRNAFSGREEGRKAIEAMVEKALKKEKKRLENDALKTLEKSLKGIRF